MNNKIVITVLGLCGALSAQAAEYWVSGVTKENGWYDANKSTKEGDSYSWDNDEIKGDQATCHAATASNLIAWWQDRIGDKVPDGTPTDAQEIWSKYKKHQTIDSSGQVAYSFQWWLTGINRPESDAEAALTRDGYCGSPTGYEKTSGYYTPLIQDLATGVIDEGSKKDLGVSASLNSFLSDISYESVGASSSMSDTFAKASFDIKTAIQAGKGVALELLGRTGYHALTLWGIDTVLDANDEEIIYK